MRQLTAGVERRSRDARHPTRERMIIIGLLFALVVVGVVPWRKDTIYEGGADSVVLAKAAIAMIAFAGAVILRLRTHRPLPIGLGPAGALSLVLLISLLGAFQVGNESATFVLVVRVCILLATVLLILPCAPWTHVLGCFLSAMGVLAVVAGVTGLGTLSEGRLGGGVPELHPNDLAEVATVPLVGIIVHALRCGVQLRHFVAAAVLLTLVVASGSRSALLGLGLAAAVAVLTTGRLERRIVTVLLVCLPIAYIVTNFTGILGSLASRGGTNAAIGALDSRFDVWRLVLAWRWESWEKWIGIGLSVKEIEVDDKWLDSQVLDSSWVSLLAQTGVVGAAITAIVLIWCIIAALQSRSRRSALLPFLILLVVRSITESGLVDSATPFILLLIVATLLTRRSRRDDIPPPLGARTAFPRRNP
ncbi:O-antigen ligase family protein [Leucobacter sp. HY1910]